MTGRPIRGIDHVGITVPDIEAATEFLVKGCGAQIIYRSFTADRAPLSSPDMEAELNLAPGTQLIASRMMKLGVGPGVELFELRASDQRPSARPSDFGLQHLALYVDDMAAAIARFEAAGGKMLSKPNPFLFPLEVGEGNLFCYGRAPWGTMIEFITYPSKMPYEDETDLRVWHSGS
jgi:catechol 2,3-dioxygenase-like lactoylglutathione lyase family enzyme